MSNMEIELTAYCGLYCGDCIRYRSKTADLARDLRDELQDTKFEKYAEVKSSSVNFVEELTHYPEFCKVMAAIVELQCREPCRVGGGCPTFPCTIVDCCQEKGFEGCWQCDGFEGCEQFASLKPFHGEAPQQNLRKIRELGLDKWAQHRDKFYVW